MLDNNLNLQSSQDYKAKLSDGFAVFDTVVVSRTFSPSRYLNLSQFDYVKGGKAFRADWLNLFCSRSPKGYQTFEIQFDINRALGFDENLFVQQTLDDIILALENINEFVSGIVGVDCRLREFGKLTRADANRDFSLPDKRERLEIFKNLEVSRMRKEIFNEPNKSGVTFSQRHSAIKIYDKYLQLENRYSHLQKFERDYAKTLLRVETQLEKRTLNKTVKNFFRSREEYDEKGKRLTLEEKTARIEQILTPDFARYVVESSLAKIEADADLMTFADWSEAVREKFSLPVAARHIEFMSDVQKRGYKAVRGKNKKSQNQFEYRKRELCAAGLWRTAFALSPKSAMVNYPNDDESFYQ